MRFPGLDETLLEHKVYKRTLHAIVARVRSSRAGQKPSAVLSQSEKHEHLALQHEHALAQRSPDLIVSVNGCEILSPFLIRSLNVSNPHNRASELDAIRTSLVNLAARATNDDDMVATDDLPTLPIQDKAAMRHFHAVGTGRIIKPERLTTLQSEDANTVPGHALARQLMDHARRQVS